MNNEKKFSMLTDSFFFHRLYEFSINCYGFDDALLIHREAHPNSRYPPPHTHTSCKSLFPKLPSAPVHQVFSGADIYQPTAT